MYTMAQRVSATLSMCWEQVPLPEPRPHEVLLRVARCGVCGTDLSIYTGRSSFIAEGLIHYPMTFGHEYTAVIERCGEAVEYLHPGDRIFGETAYVCGLCEHCLRGDLHLCPHRRPLGTINCHDGAYAERMVLPAACVHKLPDNVSLDEGALIEPAATALLCVRRACVVPGETVLVVGTGAIGLAAVALAKAEGAGRVMLAGRKDEKLAIGLSLGADDVINTMHAPLYETVCGLLGGERVDAVLEASGSIAMLKASVCSAARDARVSMVAFYDEDLSGFNLDGMIKKNVALLPSFGCRGMMPEVARLLHEGRLSLARIITHRFPLSKADEALDFLDEGRPDCVKVMLMGEEG